MFGQDEDYRKARKESKDRITKVIKVWSAREETLHDEGFQKGAEFGYNKANEWHYVKDGLPKKHGWYWVQYNNGTPDCLIVTKNLRFLDHRSSDVTDCVYAWKEIVLPELKESE